MVIRATRMCVGILARRTAASSHSSETRRPTLTYVCGMSYTSFMESARWLMLLTRLPSDAAQRERVGIWRKLKRSGAIVLRDSVYLFPAKDEALEIANWLAGEIRAS